MQTSTSARRRLAGLTAALMTAAGLSAFNTPTAQGQADAKPVDAKVRVHWAHGKALGQAGLSPGRAVEKYLDGSAGDTLRQVGRSWTVRGVTYLRMQQYVAGLRVAGSDAKAAFDSRGRLISLIENSSRPTTPRAATASEGDAVRASVRSLYSSGSPLWLRPPTAEKVAIPMSDGRLSAGYSVLTWDVDNHLNETLVAGNGSVIRSVSRTATDGYNVFPHDPETTPQTLISNPADPIASPSGWLTGEQRNVNISGPNVRAYLDVDANNAPDAGGVVDTDLVFDAVHEPILAPGTTANRSVSVQNLFYLNNLIHDTLHHAGFNVAAGNFQDNDPVLAETQDGSGFDNANFSTPPDGQSGRMQMYLWNPLVSHEVVQGGTSYVAAPAVWGRQLNTTGVTGPLVVANDGTGTTSDACERVAAIATGSIAVVDRGTCDFVVKAANVQRAGAVGIVVVNNVEGVPFPMGGRGKGVKIPGLMVSQADGAALKATVGTVTTMRLDPTPPPRRDSALDADIVWHEYGHGLTWRMIGNMSGPISGAIGEGMGDVLAVITGDDAEIAEYSGSDPAGIRSDSYEGYGRTYGDIIGEEIHFDGEVYAAIGWDLWKSYQGAGLSQSDILTDLVGGMNFTPAGPTFEAMRDGILMGLTATGHNARSCMVWRSFAKYGVGVGSSSGTARGGVATTESFAVPSECAIP